MAALRRAINGKTSRLGLDKPRAPLELILKGAGVRRRPPRPTVPRPLRAVTAQRRASRARLANAQGSRRAMPARTPPSGPSCEAVPEGLGDQPGEGRCGPSSGSCSART